MRGDHVPSGTDLPRRALRQPVRGCDLRRRRGVRRRRVRAALRVPSMRDGTDLHVGRSLRRERVRERALYATRAITPYDALDDHR
jgi:hypothetical protein